MIDLQRKILSTTNTGLLLIFAGFMFANFPARAQDTNATTMKPVVVTGSYIPTAETVGVAPVESISTPAIEQSGQQDVLAVLKKLSTTFAGNGNVGQTVNNGGFGEANVAIRNLPTVVLIDGLRMANSSFSRGSAVDLNTIPLSMIDHIEVLKDGASAIYGADAIGGVVNVITKKNYSGTEIAGRYGFATQEGHVQEERVSVVTGTTTEKSSVTAGASWYHMDPLLTKDRDPGNYTNEQLYDRNVSDANGSGRFPGRVGHFILAGDSEYLSDTFRGPGNPAFGFVPGLITPPVFPGQTFTSVQAYNAYAVANGYTVNGITYHQPVYVDIFSPPAANAPPIAKSPNGALFYFPAYTYSIQEQNRDNAFFNFSHDFFGNKKLEFYGGMFYSYEKSISKLAPSPVGNLFADGKIGVPADNPYNPFGTPFGYGGLTDPANPGFSPTNKELNVRTRFIDFGTRDFVSQKDYFHFAGGFKGDITERYSYDANFNYNRSDEQQTTLNAVDSKALNDALTPNFAVDPSGKTSILRNYRTQQYVPTYNIFALGGMGANDPSTIDAIRATLYNSGVSELYNGNAVITGRPFDLPAGPFAFAAGMQYINESLQIDFDHLQVQGNVPGLNPAFPTPKSTRTRWAGYAEVKIPVLGPDQNVPVLHSVEITAAGRYETLDPGGSKAVPKVGVRWQPFDEQLTIRGTYSQGFIAPSIYTIFGAPLVNNPAISLPNGTVQEQVSYLSNPTLPSADSVNYTVGAVFSPKAIKGLTLSVDYYNINLENTFYNPDANGMFAGLNAASAAAAAANDPSILTGYHWYKNYTKPNGQFLSPGDQIIHGEVGNMSIPTLPGAAQKTAGIDLSANYELPTENWGKFNFWCNANVLLNFEFKNGPQFPFNQPDNQQFLSYKGEFTDPNYIGQGFGTLPDYQITPGVTWNFHDFTYTVSARYIPGVLDPGDNHPFEGGSLNGTGNGATIDGTSFHVSSWYSIDMQLAYEFKNPGKWYDRTRLAVGCNNVTDHHAPLIAASTEDHTDKSTYDVLGRFIYFEIAKKF